MIARKLKPSEYYLSERNMGVAFEGEFDFEKELEKSKTQEPDPRADHYGAFIGSPQDPVATFVMNKYDVRFDGHIVKMGGVGGVASLPPYRRGGYIRACMNVSLRDLYDEGFVLSALYGFKTSYYRKFGFENGAYYIDWTIPLKELDIPDQGGRTYQILPGEDLSPLLEVYNEVYKDTNVSVIREEFDSGLREKNYLNEKRSVFVWEDENGRPGAFMVAGRKGEVLDCYMDFGSKNCLLFKDARALRAMLHFVRTSFIDNFKSVRFETTDGVDALAILPEVGNTDEIKTDVNGMHRVVNVEQALKLCRCKGEGTAVIKVRDDILPENNDTFRITFGPNTENKVERVSDSPDAELDIGDFSVLLLGVKSAEDMKWMVKTKVYNKDALGGLFYRKPCHMLELF